jgi:hypothetical protein
MGIGEQLKKRTKQGASTKVGPDTMWTTPWQWRDEEGVYVGTGGSVWLYRAVPLDPLDREDHDRKLDVGANLASLLGNIGATSSVPIGAIRKFSNNREIHLVCVTWEVEAQPPEGTNAELSDYLRETLGFPVPRRTLLIGIRLRSSVKSAVQNDSLSGQLKKVATKALLEDVPDREAYIEDREAMSMLCGRFGCRRPSPEELAQLESWYNLGRGPDATIVEGTTSLEVPGIDHYEISALMRFNTPVMRAPYAPWVLSSLTHPDAPKVVSVRAELEPAVVGRARARRNQRRVASAMKEEAATGDLERVEFSQTYEQAQELEQFFVDAGEPLLTNCSILMARSIRPVKETYIDYLRQEFDIDMKPLEHRQIRALDEMLPTSNRRLNPFLQDVTIAMLAYSGINGFANLGDRTGCYVGLANPDYTPVYIDPSGAAKENVPGAMLVAGDSGSGKTFFCQNLALQATLGGSRVIFVNPKANDSLAPFAQLVGGSVVKMSAMQTTPGAFDPFRYAPGPVAAEIATSHIVGVLGGDGGFTQAQELELASALKRGVLIGAQCVGDCFPLIEDQSIVVQIHQQVEGSSLFALGIGLTAAPKYTAQSGLTLIEFDRRLDLPEGAKPANTYTRNEKIALAALRLVTRASLEMLREGGGVMVLDEAWTFLGHPDGQAMLQQLGRESRSMNILPVFATQRVADIISRDMEGYLSRVFCFSSREEREARAALELCGLEPTDSQLSWLRNCGPVRGDDETPARPPMALHRDLKGRHGAVVLGPVPERARIAFSTNLLDREAREEAAGESADGANR